MSTRNVHQKCPPEMSTRNRQQNDHQHQRPSTLNWRDDRGFPPAGTDERWANQEHQRGIVHSLAPPWESLRKLSIIICQHCIFGLSEVLVEFASLVCRHFLNLFYLSQEVFCKTSNRGNPIHAALSYVVVVAYPRH